MKKERRTPKTLLKKIYATVPIPTVDFIITRTKGGRREFLLGNRTNKPYKNEWFVIGGHILWGETMEQAVKRQFKKELGIVPKKATFLFHYSFVNPPNNIGAAHSALLHLYLVELSGNPKFRLNSENSEVKWFDKIDRRWPKPLQDILKLAGF